MFDRIQYLVMGLTMPLALLFGTLAYQNHSAFAFLAALFGVLALSQPMASWLERNG